MCAMHQWLMALSSDIDDDDAEEGFRSRSWWLTTKTTTTIMMMILEADDLIVWRQCVIIRKSTSNFIKTETNLWTLGITEFEVAVRNVISFGSLLSLWIFCKTLRVFKSFCQFRDTFHFAGEQVRWWLSV